MALVGAVGGAGTTRLCVEFAATLARDDRDVAVFDAAQRSLDGRPVFAAIARKLAADGAGTVTEDDEQAGDDTAVDFRVVSVVTDRYDRAVAVAGGLAAALGTDLLLLSGLSYFQYGQYALPAAGWVAELLATA